MDKTIPEQIMSLLDASNVLIAVYNEDDIIVYFNEAFGREFGLQRDEKLTWADLMRRGVETDAGCNSHARAANFEQWLAAARSRRGKESFKSFETDMRSGRWVLMTETINADGWMISIAPDITSLQKTDVKTIRMDRDIAERLSQIDELTGIFNRRGIMNALNGLNPQEIGYSLSILDIDLFKSINDTYGHDCGDAVIRHFTSSIIKGIRGSDYIGRYGGEEFLLIFPGTTPSEARNIIDRIRDSMTPVLCGNNEIKYSFSAGVAYSRDVNDRDNSIIFADQALYYIKNNGRGSTCIYDSFDRISPSPVP
ncbi:MAG: diguanylate cyclase [Arachidicoccus sp.]|nr:diguanylate cyclase [Arachidicoccus sp.]